MSNSTRNTTSEGMQSKHFATRFSAWLSSDRVEPWRDWAVLLVIVHALLITAAVGQLSWPLLLALSVPLGLVLATATLTVLH
ncbi:MAG: hypothetical protein JHC87_08005, partial [Thermoleophilaceae bacterium]|nr:hypothetical protein [Thermoleophilaceae bacterium]